MSDGVPASLILGGIPVFSRLRQSLFNFRQRSRVRHFALGLLLCLVFGALSSPLLAQTAISRATVTEILDSNQVFIQESQARVRDVANRGQRVRTAQARANLTYNTGAVIRLLANTSLTVGECARLDRGITLISGAVNGCTASVTAGVRGTTYLMEVDENGEELVKVLEGEVIVTRQALSETGTELTSSPSTPPVPENSSGEGNPEEANQVVLTAGQKVAARRGDRRLGPVQRLSLEEFLDILRGELINGFTDEIPGLQKVREAFQQLYPNAPFPFETPSLPISRPRLPFL
ncbi:MAG: hypothetical protein SFY66_26005 [Oculatellaceae cyanobacterium bins.114]|nr:hypothetical protein [Oculatellaceae cyanobacterium bins.114]